MTMTYYGATGGTAGSSAANPPILLIDGIGKSSTTVEAAAKGNLHGNNVWFYSSTNAPSDCAGVAAFSDGGSLGMKAGDLVLGITASGGSTGALPWFGVVVCTASSTNPGGVCSTVGAQISSAYTTA